MTFFLVAVVMCLTAGLVLALPLWRARLHAHAGVAAANSAVHAARLSELQQDLEAGRLSAADHAAAMRDLEADLAAGGAPEQVMHVAAPQRITAVVSLVSVLVLAGGLYWSYGSWRVGAQGLQAASAQAVVDMVQQLADRLQTPEGQQDVEGWEMLGHSYMLMERYPDALKALEHARALTQDKNPEVLAEYAEAETLTDPDHFMDKAAPLFEKVLGMQPRNAQALWYGGLAAEQRGDAKLAVQRWNALLAQDVPADYRAYISQAIVQAGGAPLAAAAGISIKLHVSLSKTLPASLTPDSTVFIYVQPKGGEEGPPLAARRFKLTQLPLDVSLSDQDAVVPGRVISAYDAVVVSARISKSGTAAPHRGDLIGQAEWMKASPRPLAIVIDTVLK
jgi:cytochrome c-type biogenesis protein CcmH